MTRVRLVAWCVSSFLVGALATAGLAQSRKLSYTPDLVAGKPPQAVGAVLLDGALQLAGSGSWERLAVGRAWYLGGDKKRGQEIIDGVLQSRKVAASDWFRAGRIYTEAGEWDRAKDAFEKALAADEDDDSGMIEYGALANLQGDRERAETLFARAMKKNPREFWHWVNAGGSYLGVKPQ
jgi:tetratricopeptide (TPR) repeat protein